MFESWQISSYYINSTQIYTHLLPVVPEQFHCATAETTDEAQKLIEEGFKYVNGDLPRHHALQKEEMTVKNCAVSLEISGVSTDSAVFRQVCFQFVS